MTNRNTETSLMYTIEDAAKLPQKDVSGMGR